MMQTDRRDQPHKDDNVDRSFRKEGSTLRDLLQVQPIKSEQENLRFLEWLAGLSEKELVALRLYRMLVSLELSVLQRYVGKSPGVTEQEMGKWRGELRSCTVGYVSMKIKSSGTRALTTYIVCVEGDGSLRHVRSEASEATLKDATEIVSNNLYHAQTCRFSILHDELRTRLSKVAWLEDQFGRVNPAADKAKDVEAAFLG